MTPVRRGDCRAAVADTPYHPTERRPITARGWPIWQRIARWLARRGISPNGISIAGMVCGIGAGIALAAKPHAAGWERVAWLAAAALIQLRLLANLLDGMVAIESGRASPVGELYNEVPDRVSDTATIVGAGHAVGGDVVLAGLAACAAMFTAYVRAMGKAAGARHEFCGPMAKQQRMALLTAVAAATGLCPVEWLPGRTAFGGRGLVAAALAVILVGSLVTAARRLARIAACATAPAKCTCNAASTLSTHHGGPAFFQAAASRTEPLHQIRTCLLRA